VALLGVLLVLLARTSQEPPPHASGAAAPEAPLLVYCAAALREAVEQASRAYGHPVQFQFGGSQTLLANAELSHRGDLYIPAEDAYIRMGREKGLVAESIPMARMSAVLGVARGNPKSLHAIEDLLRPEVKLAQANPDAAAIGKVVREALRKSGQWEALEKKTTVFKPTVTDVANDIKLGLVDAGFVWDVTVKQMPDLEKVELTPLLGVTAEVAGSVLRSADHPAAALRFARFLAAQGAVFERLGFRHLEADVWSETPELKIYAGSMLRPAIEKTLRQFEAREGTRISVVYNGCGILVAGMRAGERPDLFFACDESFLKQVSDLYLDPRPVSQNQLVILVPKGNPHKIRSLKDLGQPGLKVGVGHEKQCALGALTKDTLLQTELYREVMKNVVVQSPTGDMLVNQLRVGSLDAAVAYVSNAAGAGEALQAIAIDIPCALAVQPVAIGRESRHKRMALRLVEALTSPESRRQFESEGFRWKATGP
jgi:molybdenum ABC transporter molybdate-binding protein